MPQNQILKFKKKIVNYLKKYHFAIINQILKDIKNLNINKLSSCLELLLKEDIVSVFENMGSKLYFLSSDEKFIKIKINNLNGLIINIIKELGPISTQELSNHLMKHFAYRVGIRFISKFAKNLANKGKISYKKKGLMRIFYDKNDETQIFELKRIFKSVKVDQIKSACEYYYKEVIPRWSLSSEQIKKLKRLWDENSHLIFSFNCQGRLYLDVVCVLHAFYIKQKLRSLISLKISFEDLRIWLEIDYIITKVNQDIFQGLKRRIYYSYVREILNNPLFGEEIKEKAEIFHLPSFLMKMSTILISRDSQ